MPFGLGVWELVILGVILALLFGARGVPEAARRLGLGMREVKDAVAEADPRRVLDERAKSNADAEERREPPRAG